MTVSARHNVHIYFCKGGEGEEYSEGIGGIMVYMLGCMSAMWYELMTSLETADACSKRHPQCTPNFQQH